MNNAPYKSKGTVHIVVDLETLNTKPYNPNIMQVGIAAIFPDGFKQYWQGTCKHSMFNVDTATWNWWHDLDRISLFNFLTAPNVDKYPNQEALLTEANKVIGRMRKDFDVMMWGNSPTFDLTPFHVLLGSANLAWNYRDERDLRTIRSLYKYDSIQTALSWSMTSEVVTAISKGKDNLNTYPINRLEPHNALYDAALELEQLRAMVQQIEYMSIKDMDAVHNGLLVGEPSKGR